MDFPVFRKYINGRSYFKIFSPLEFEELKITGRYYSIIFLQGKILPERNFIFDMLHDYTSYWEAINEGEYEEKKRYCEENLQKVIF